MTSDQLKAARQSLGLTQTQMAEWLGVARGHIARLEAGERNASETLCKLLQAYLDGWRPRA